MPINDYLLSNIIKGLYFLTWPILEARAEIFQKIRSLENLEAPKFPTEFNWPLTNDLQLILLSWPIHFRLYI